MEIVSGHNGESVIYQCIGPCTSGKTVSDSKQPEEHKYFELEALPANHTHQYADINQVWSDYRVKDQNTAKLGKPVPIYEDICSQKFQVC